MAGQDSSTVPIKDALTLQGTLNPLTPEYFVELVALARFDDEEKPRFPGPTEPFVLRNRATGETAMIPRLIEMGLKWPPHPRLRELCVTYGISPLQILPPSFRLWICFFIYCHKYQIIYTSAVFKYWFKTAIESGWVSFEPRDGTNLPRRERRRAYPVEKDGWFFVTLRREGRKKSIWLPSNRSFIDDSPPRLSASELEEMADMQKLLNEHPFNEDELFDLGEYKAAGLWIVRGPTVTWVGLLPMSFLYLPCRYGFSLSCCHPSEPYWTSATRR